MSAETLDALARIAANLGGVTIEQVIRVLIFEHEALAALARLNADTAVRPTKAVSHSTALALHLSYAHHPTTSLRD